MFKEARWVSLISPLFDCKKKGMVEFQYILSFFTYEETIFIIIKLENAEILKVNIFLFCRDVFRIVLCSQWNWAQKFAKFPLSSKLTWELTLPLSIPSTRLLHFLKSVNLYWHIIITYSWWWTFNGFGQMHIDTYPPYTPITQHSVTALKILCASSIYPF